MSGWEEALVDENTASVQARTGTGQRRAAAPMTREQRWALAVLALLDAAVLTALLAALAA